MSMANQITLALAVMLAAPGVHAESASRKSWQELSNEVESNWKVRIVLPDSTVVEGGRARFTEDQLTMEVSKTSNSRAHPKGALAVPRGSVKTLELRRHRIRGQVLGAAIPLGLGASLAGAGAAKGIFDGGALMVSGLAVAIAAVPMYFAGRSSDRRWETVTVVP